MYDSGQYANRLQHQLHFKRRPGSPGIVWEERFLWFTSLKVLHISDQDPFRVQSVRASVYLETCFSVHMFTHV